MGINDILNWDYIMDFDSIVDPAIHIPNDIIVYALDLTVYITGIGIVKKYYATRGIYFDSGNGVNYYEPRLKQPGNFQQSLFADGTTKGTSQTGFGEVVLINSDGGLDDFHTYGCDGRSYVLRRIIGNSSAIVLSCNMEQPIPTWDTVPIRLKTKGQVFDVPIQTAKYLGDNALPDGVEGVEDVKGKPKPLLFGQVLNATPVCVNTSKLIYQLHESTLSDISAVYDKGANITRGSDYTDLTDMLATAPSAGYYRPCLSEGMFRLGSSPVGDITADATEGIENSVAQITKRIALRVLLSSEINNDAFTALDALNNSIVGIYINSESNINPVVDELTNSIGGWCIFNEFGVLTVGRFEIPSSSYSAFLTLNDGILDIQRLPTNDESRGIPSYKINLNYNKNFTVQKSSTLAGSVSIERKQFLAEEFRTFSVSYDAVLSKHPNSKEINLSTLLVNSADAEYEASRVSVLRMVDQDFYLVKIPCTVQPSTLLGKSIKLQINRYGLNNGKLFNVIGISSDFELNTTELKLWGSLQLTSEYNSEDYYKEDYMKSNI
jgi:hypothetical protein